MDKETILEKSREENEGMDERERAVYARSGTTAGKIGLLLCSLISLVQLISTGTVNTACWLICSGMNAAERALLYYNLRRRTDLLYAVLYGAAAVTFMVLFVLEVVT